MTAKSRQITATELRAKCQQLIDEVVKTKKEIVITKYGKPVAKLVPYSMYGSLKGSFTYIGDIISPTDENDWDANT